MEDPYFIRKGNRYVKIQQEDIQFLKAAGSYVKLVTATEELALAVSIAQFAKRNEALGLIRVHRSFLINLSCVDSFDNSFVYIGDYQIPIGASFRRRFMKRANVRIAWSGQKWQGKD